MFEKFKQFWSAFWNSIKTAYSTVFKDPEDPPVQKWRDIVKINLLSIFVTKLNNLANVEATFEVQTDSTLAEPLVDLCKDIEAHRFEIGAGMLADGDFFVFPATDRTGNFYHSYLPQERVRITDTDGENIKECYGIIDWHINSNNIVYYLLRHHKLLDDGTLELSYSTVTSEGKQTTLDRWSDLTNDYYRLANANHIGIGRYKSPQDSRGLSPVYGVPLNYACGEIEKRIFNDLDLIEREFKNGESKIFTDPRNLLKAEKDFKFAGNIIPVQARSGQTGAQVEVFNPNLRFSEHYSKLVNDMAMYEKEVGTSKGILTDNETTETATATAVKRANADTIALLNKIRTAIDAGNRMTLEADGVFLNIRPELWNYSSDWFDPFEDPAEQWDRLMQAKQVGAVENEDLIKWLYPNLTDEQINEKLEKLTASANESFEDALERALTGA